MIRQLNFKGRCCGRKPITYKRPPHLFCPRCDASFNPSTGRQIPNWAYRLTDDGDFVRNDLRAKMEGK
jgi:hypothetical protein